VEHKTLNIKRVRLRVLNIAREEKKQVVVDISASVGNVAIRKTRI
jgi:hypothetical protein